MKGFYTLLAAAAVTLSASAVDLNVKNLQLRSTEGLRKEVVKTNNTLIVSEKAGKVEKSTRVLAARKADTAASIEGEWIFVLGDYYNEGNSVGPFEASFTATLEDGVVFFEDPTNDELPFVAEYDENTGALVFNKEYLGPINVNGYGTLQLFQEPYLYVYVPSEHIEEQSITAQYNAGTIEFDTTNGDPGLMWSAYSNTLGSEDSFVGTFAIYDLISATKVMDWTSLGKGQWKENIVRGMFLDPTTTSVEVDVLENPLNPGVYKIVDAYAALYAGLAIDSKSPDLVFDATDPTNVLIELQSTGISAKTSTATLGVLYVFNEGWYSETYGDPLDPTLKCTLTTDGELYTLTLPYHSCTVYASTAEAFYYGSADVSVLTFTKPSSGVANISVDSNANAPVEYFNLQGVRVANPEAGQLVIRRQGTTVEKVVLR